MILRKNRAVAAIVTVITATLLMAGGALTAFAPVANAAACVVSGDTGTAPNQCGPYVDTNIHAGSAGSNIVVQNDVWSPPTGYTNALCQTGSATPCETVTSNAAESWSVTANLPNNSGAVESYPDVSQYTTLANNTPDPITNYTNMYSTFSDTPAGGAGNSYDVGYDIWGGSVAAGANGNYADEIMIWTSQDNRAGCGGASPTLTGVQFGGTNGVPVQSWNLYNYGTERIWCNPALNEPSSSVDVYGMLHYLMAPGYNGNGSLPSDFGLNAVQYGVENCYTSGFDTFSLSSFTLQIGTGSGQMPPTAITNAATAITNTGATLNGSVNPNGAATTYKFDYGTSNAYGSSIPAPSGSAGSGTTAVNESASPAGLSAGTLYHYRIEAANSGGTSFGSDQTFTTTGGGGGGAITVSASVTNPHDTVQLKTFVTDGGKTGGAVATNGFFGTPQFTLTPVASKSLLLQGVYNAQSAIAITPAPSVTSDDSGNSGNTLAWEDGHYTGTVTGGTGVTLGGTDDNQWNAFSGYEVEPAVAGTSPTIDATTPVTVVGSSTSATTGSFSPPAGSLLVAIVQSQGTAPQVVSVSNTGQTLAWTQAGTTFSNGYEGTDAVFTAVVPGSSQSAPVVSTTPASGVTSTGATLNGSVNPGGAATTYQFDYGTTTSYGTSVPVPAGNAGSGTTAVNENAALTGLSSSTAYHYRIEATNSGGTTLGSDQQFTTSATAQAPGVVTQAATSVGSAGAALNGTVNPNGQASTYQFEYGTTTGYGSVSPSTPGSAGSGSTAVPETTTLTGLTPSTAYHFRLDATNATGVTLGTDMQFTTSAAGGGSVTYGSTGPSSAGAKKANTLTLTWTQNITGSNPAVLAETAVGDTNDVNCGLGITDNGVAMTKLSIVHDNNQNAGYFDVFGLAGPPSGTNTFVATVTNGCAGGTPKELTGGSESFTGVSQSAPFGTAATAFGSGSTATVATTGSTIGNLVAGFAANGSSITSAVSPSTSRYIANQNNDTGAGNSAGATSPSTGSAVTMKWNLTSDWWGAAAVEVQHS